MWTAFSHVLFRLCRENRSERTHLNKNGSSSSPLPSSTTPKEVTADHVSDYLFNHPEYLERYIMDEVEVEQLERWIIRKSQRLKKKPEAMAKNGRKTSLSRWKFCVHADKRKMLQNLTQSLQHRPTKDHVLWELANCISSAVNADGFKLFLVDRGNHESMSLYLGLECNSEGGEPRLQKIHSGVRVPAYVARTGETVRLSRGYFDPRFPDGVLDETEMAHILCQSVQQPDGELAAVLELWRGERGTPFHEEDEEIASSYLVWGGIALHYAHLYFNMNQQKKLNDFLLDVVKSIFQDMVSMDALIVKIMNFAQKLVDADRASLFLVDSKNKELYATVFDVGIGGPESDSSCSNEESAKSQFSNEIRIPLGTGIAGMVAMTGEILNIKDAYADCRFNSTVDQLTGYKTNTILCMPIFIRGSLIGVVQMVNKHQGFFTKEDETAFEMFAIYCGLALHHAKLYDKIRKSEQKYKVALEVLSYHNTCTEEEYVHVEKDGIPDKLLGVDDYYFNPFQLEDYQKARYSMYMFTDLFGLGLIDPSSLMRFTLTVKKNYRRVPYHNWTHGFSVANSMYSIIKRTGSLFSLPERLALFVGALCHDLDHRGKNNKFMLDSESPIATIYTTSTMEHHHFNQTVTILQQEGHNIFGKLTNSEYKNVLGHLKDCILATDLALYFSNREKLSYLVETNSFSWTNLEHRLLLRAISMTASDLSASAKPWEIQVKTVKIIFEEFYQQGDAEKASGRQPIPMMDRNQPEEQASSQVGFLKNICFPCYSLLYRLIPESKPLLDMCQQNLKKWEQKEKEIKAK
ncbi:probable 3',5'-cyclic phosphodiesterase pde-5 isoform X3 [Harmonia axyridis]|uniref:probable 3',5'-cyclic phosphodiesterase pde-5 isoform X3 n=1 Tax=Harmonia axyridis TaxID=115357 RepID=UPI001E2782EB|nr:probable 3',5'-cyclic phosphodiesterase pde-5 isoform X3 [Harmonia axyridis]